MLSRTKNRDFCLRQNKTTILTSKGGQMAVGNKDGALKQFNELKAAYPDAAPLLASILTSLEVAFVNNVY